MNENPLENIGGLSKIANTLIEKVSDVVGGMFKPYQIRRVAKAKAEEKLIDAKAEAEANLIHAKSNLEIKELTHRAMHRFVEEETKKQVNIENITAKAIPLLREDATPENMDNDWITNFFDKSRIISDTDMQELWSKILAGEANNPNSYSKRTVNLLISLDKRDAELFSRLCIYNWSFGNLWPIIFDPQNEIYRKNGMNFSSLKHLDSIGLISFEPISGYESSKLPKKTTLQYYSKSYLFEFVKNADNEIDLGNVLLTQVGQELARICSSPPDYEFAQYAIAEWNKKGITINEI